MVRNLIIQAIELYQATLSPDHSPLRHLYPYGFCRKHPTCSEYGKLIIAEKGVTVGSIMLLWRLVHCNPWTQPDPARLTSTNVAHR